MGRRRCLREVGLCDGRLRLRTGEASRRFALAAEANQQFAVSLPSRDLLLTYSVKSGSVAVNSGHILLLSFGMVEGTVVLLNPCLPGLHGADSTNNTRPESRSLSRGGDGNRQIAKLTISLPSEKDVSELSRFH